MAVVIGGLTGWITYYTYAWGLEITGRWLGGRAKARTLRTVLAWALVPTCLTLLTTALGYAIQGDNYFRDSDLDVNGSNGLVLLLLGIVEVILGGWALVILVRGIMLVQQVGAGRAIVNMLLPGLLLLALVAGFMGLHALLKAAIA